MALILGIETSCDETAAAVFDTTQQRIIAHFLYSQIDTHKAYGGVVPEIASRSHLEKIGPIVAQTLAAAGCTIHDITAIAVTSKPGLAGSLLVGFCYAKGMAWARGIPLLTINHLEGHIFSALLETDGSLRTTVPFPHICLTVSGGHTALYRVNGLGDYTLISNTRDDAAGEAFDKIAKLIGFGYPGGAIIEKYAAAVGFEDFFQYPRSKPQPDFSFSFSGLKTAILYDLAKRGCIDIQTGTRTPLLTTQVQHQVASSLLVCIGDIFVKSVIRVLEAHPDIKALTFVGGVACNKYLRKRLQEVANAHGIVFHMSPPQFCTDNGSMIALVGSYRWAQGEHAAIDCDIF
jgi:N6-L-threonylcarbamoyladenine synthase